MREVFRFIEQPRSCSYLPRETASLEIRAIQDMTAAEYADLLARGYRRFGWQVFRPACARCAECRSIRVLASEFIPSASERRILRKNETIRAELYRPFAAPEIIALYNRYHRFMNGARGWPLQQSSTMSYEESFLSGAIHLGRQWLYFDNDRLVGVAMMDEAPGAISLVYCFYDPEWRDRSPGTFSVLNQLRYARDKALDYAYLGYWVEGCPSMSYKRRFRPHQMLAEYPPENVEPVWR
jgi:arginine-tRNA-protein transferase